VSDLQLLLLAVRLRSRGSAAAIRHTFVHLGGDELSDIEADLAVAEAGGLIRSRGDERRRSLTPVGEEELRALLAAETDDVGRAAITTAYEAFLPLNQEFLAAVTATEGNERRARLGRLTQRLIPAIGSLSDRLRRFNGYPARFDRALANAEKNSAWIDSPGLDSVHTIWFEFHEHLLATLGLTRTAER
jgi:hypothetical protein